MNQEDITRMAREAGFVGSNAMLCKFAALIAAAEREACARLCDKMFHDWTNQEFDSEDEALRNKPDAEDCKKAIRARGEK